MYLIWAPGRPRLLITGTGYVPIDTNGRGDAFIAAGVPTRNITAVQHDLITDTYVTQTWHRAPGL